MATSTKETITFHTFTPEQITEGCAELGLGELGLQLLWVLIHPVNPDQLQEYQEVVDFINSVDFETYERVNGIAGELLVERARQQLGQKLKWLMD